MEHEQELKALARRYAVEQVKRRKQGSMWLDYISIDATIGRLNEVLGAGWSFDPVTEIVKETDRGYFVYLSGTLHALGKRCFGCGADAGSDLDKVGKTALAEAIKKAAHQLGVGLYLWDETERDTIAQVRLATEAGDDVKALKIQVIQLALDAGVPATGDAMAEHFGVTREELGSRETLEAILAAA